MGTIEERIRDAERRLLARYDVSATEKGTRVAREVAVHVVGSERPAIVYSMIALYQGPR